MIRVQHVSFAYPPLFPAAAPADLLRDITLTLEAGEALALWGATGSGKSTLGLLLAGLAPAHTGGTFHGRITVAGEDPQRGELSPATLGLLFQDPAAQLFTCSVEDEVAWGLEALGIPAPAIAPRVYEALRRFELLPYRQRAPWTLSGGQQKRLALAALWAMRPRVLVLDEALGGLDPAGQAEVLRSLQTLREEGLTLLLMTHDPRIARLTGRSAWLTDGELRSLVPAELEPVLRAAGVLWSCAQVAPWAPRRSAAGLPVALELRQVHFAYPEGLPVLRDVSLTVHAGECVALVGPNGAGKSTLIRHFIGLARPQSGSVWVQGRLAATRAVGDLARDVGFLFQRPEQQFFAATVRDEIAYGPRQLRLPDVSARVAQGLERFGLAEVADWPPAVLSYGQQRAVTLASLAALETPILVLDEPTVGLDGQGRRQFMEWLAERRAAGVTIVLVTHEMDLAALADRVVLMAGGRIVAQGLPEHVLPQVNQEGARELPL